MQKLFFYKNNRFTESTFFRIPCMTPTLKHHSFELGTIWHFIGRKALY